MSMRYVHCKRMSSVICQPPKQRQFCQARRHDTAVCLRAYGVLLTLTWCTHAPVDIVQPHTAWASIHRDWQAPLPIVALARPSLPRRSDPHRRTRLIRPAREERPPLDDEWRMAVGKPVRSCRPSRHLPAALWTSPVKEERLQRHPTNRLTKLTSALSRNLASAFPRRSELSARATPRSSSPSFPAAFLGGQSKSPPFAGEAGTQVCDTH
ncbi:hypothetical protein OH77DRAFT_117015 [Trametes cingulata]|nr:hypothetical protein OH77DRAFT_117015 [Trametes cingulata]